MRCKSKTVKGTRCSLKRVPRSSYCKRHNKSCGIKKLVKKLEKEREKKHYRVLTGRSKDLIREYYKSLTRVPRNKKVKFYDKNGNLVANGYESVVIGDHGAYLEFDKTQIRYDLLKTKEGEEWRENNNSPYVKYNWKETPNGTKVYEQTKKVRYAEYKVGYFYIDPNDLFYLIKNYSL